jgi:ribose transport system substrate-binding protein
MRHGFVRLLILLGLTLLVPACSRSSGKKQIAFVSNNPHGFWTYAERGCEKAAREADVELVFRRPETGTSVAQQNIINDLMVKGIKGLAISPNDAGNLQDFLKNKVASKIPLVTQDNDVPDPSVRRCYIGTHNYRAGRAAGALVEKAVPKGGKIAIFVGQMDAPNAVERRQGLLDYLAGRQQSEIGEKTPPDAANLPVGKYTLVGTRTDDSSEVNCQNKAQELLRVEPDIACMIGLWEYNPPALLRAVKGSKSKPAIIAFDENFQTLEGIQSGDIFGTVVQNPFQFGYESIKILAALAKGDDSVLKNRKDIDAQNRIYIPHRIIVKNPANTTIGDSPTLDVEVFFPEIKKLKSGESK